MGRIKTDDPVQERAHAMADALTAARQPLHPGLRLGDLIDALERVEEKDKHVEFDFGGFEPTGISSYRGYYSDLALQYDGTALNTGQLLETLKKADGAVFTGYKGGDYQMNRSTPVWVANYGEAHGVAVIAVEDQGYRVLLRTYAMA